MESIGFIPDFGNLAFTLAAFVAALSIIVFVHEFGHYIVGRWSGIHAEVFSIGFGPVLASRRDRHGTKWQVAAFPLGGYVKFLGDSDAASATQDEGFLQHIVKAERDKELRRSMLGAPLWARSATVAAGPVFNFLFSILVLAGLYLGQGVPIEPPTVGRLPSLPGVEAGLEPGDVILEVEGRATPSYQALSAALDAIEVAPRVTYLLRRDGAERVVEGAWPFPVLVDAVSPNSAAIDAGLRVGDLIVAVDGQPITAFSELQKVALASPGRDLKLQVRRGAELLEFTLAPRIVDEPALEGGFEKVPRIGIRGRLIFDPATESLGVGKALQGAAAQVWFIAKSSLSGLWHMIRGSISSCSLRGPIGIAETSGEMAGQGVQSFIGFIALLSTAVGLLNLFPIPVLDGGHLVFHAWEAVTGKPPSDRALRLLMAVGLTLIIGLMAFALGNDLFCP